MTYSQAIQKFNFSGRNTIRSVFDFLSNEWNQTLISEKIIVLREMISNKQSLLFYLEEHIKFYGKELENRRYVVETIPKSINVIVRNCNDEKFKDIIIQQYLEFVLHSNYYLEFHLEMPEFIKEGLKFKPYFHKPFEGKTFDDVFETHRKEYRYIQEYNYLEFYKELAVEYEVYELAEKLKNKIQDFNRKDFELVRK